MSCAPDPDVLNAAIRAGVDWMRVGCRGGGCGVCRVCRVIVCSGEYVAGRMSKRLVDGREGCARYALACRVYPASDLTIEPAPFVTAAAPTLKQKLEDLMAIESVMRVGHVQLRVLDLEAAVRHYTEDIGLIEVARADGRVYLKAWDEFDHHSLVLHEGDDAGLDHFAFKVRNESDLDRIEGELAERAIGVTKIDVAGRLVVNRASVEERIGRDWNVQELQ